LYGGDTDRLKADLLEYLNETGLLTPEELLSLLPASAGAPLLEYLDETELLGDAELLGLVSEEALEARFRGLLS
jgi:hypothetical protein